MAAGFLDIHIFPGLAGPNRGQRMPVVCRGDGNRVNILILQQLPDVLIFFHALEILAPLLQYSLVDVAQGNDASAFHLAELARYDYHPAH